MSDLMRAVEQILDDGHLHTDTLAQLRAAYAEAHGDSLYILALEKQNRRLREAAEMALETLEHYGIDTPEIPGVVDRLREALK